jgi:hypothetical protein
VYSSVAYADPSTSSGTEGLRLRLGCGVSRVNLIKGLEVYSSVAR